MIAQPLDVLSALAFAAAAIVGAIVTFRRPAWGIALLLFVDPFAFYHSIGRTTVTLPKAVLAGIVVALLVKRIPLRALWAPQARPLTIGALALVAANALSAIPATYIDVVARETLKSLEYAIVFGCCVVATVADPDLRPFRFALLGVVALVSLEALAQEFIGAPSAASVGGHVVQRIAGPLEGPNQLAGYLGLAVPVLFALALLAKDRVALGVGALASVCLVLTLSRAGIASTVASVGLILVVSRGANVRLALAAVIGTCAVALGGLTAVGGLTRVFSVQEVSSPDGLATRSELWAAALALWKRSPLLGVGAGNYELDLPSTGLEGVRTHANSLYLQALAEGGVPLLAATLWTLYASIATFAKAGLRDPLLLGIMAASLGFALHEVFDLLIFFPKIGTFWWILLGVGVGRIINAREYDAQVA
jgi:O-antigen ligase